MVSCLDSVLTVLLSLLCEWQIAYDAWYGMAHPPKPRGRAVIIANSSFHQDRLRKREGTEVDVRKLKSVFIWLNFDVVVRNNLTSEVRYTCLTEHASSVVNVCTSKVTVAFLVNILIAGIICLIHPSLF